MNNLKDFKINNASKIIIAAATVLFLGFLAWYFSSIVVYIIISAILSMIGHPLVRRFDKIKIWKFKIPHSLNAFFTLIILLAIFVGFIWFFVPLIAGQAQMLSGINIPEVLDYFKEPIEKAKEFLIQFDVMTVDQTLESFLETQLESVVNIATFSTLFTSLLSTTGSFLMAAFSILFITYFFLRDENMFEHFILLLTPEEYTEEVGRIFSQTKYLLTRYFFGLMLEVGSMITLITIGLTILGIKNALIIGFLGGLMNIIPYLGPLIGGSMGVMIGLATTLSQGMYDKIGVIALGIIGSFAFANLIDNIILQPLIYSNSVKARPIEIFIVIIMAGSLAGITGMILAIPAYTILRITAKEFLTKSKLVRKLTEKI